MTLTTLIPNTPTIQANDLTMLVLAPTGRDAELLVSTLKAAENTARAVQAAEALEAVRIQQAGGLLIAEEALSPTFIAELGEVLANQPSWSDFPVLVLTSQGRETDESRRLERERLPLINHILLERPLRTATLIASVRTELRGRRRQYEVRDSIAELERASRALAESEERSRLILQSTRDCIKLLDLQANILSINLEGQEQLAISDFDMVRNTSWLSFWQAPFEQLAQEAIETARAGGEGRFEGEFLRSDGKTLWWDVSVTPVRDGGKSMTHLLVVSREITIRKRAELALIESEKLAAVGRLAASISHEINNPLEAVTNLLYLATLDTALSEQTREYLSMADRELARVSQIAGQTLRFHRQATRPRRMKPQELIEPVLALYQGRLNNSHIAIDFDTRQGDAITCYEGDVRQVLNNLVGNAIDAMRLGGRLRIRTQGATEWRTGARGARITIADSGHGMSSAVARRIFEAFYTTKGINGTGLGLWISYGIVQKHKGSLKVRSREQAPSGTVFSLFLPNVLPASTQVPLDPAV